MVGRERETFIFSTSSSTLDPTSEFAKTHKVPLAPGHILGVYLKSQNKHSAFSTMEPNLLDGQSFKTVIELANMLCSRKQKKIFLKIKYRIIKTFHAW